MSCEPFWGAKDALGLADLIRSGAVSRREVLDRTIARIEELDTPINSVVMRFFEDAMADAGTSVPEGPFAGVPMLVKDAQTSIAGKVMTQGSRIMTQNVAVRTADLVSRMEAAGAVILGRSSSAEFGSMFETHTPLYGTTRNPWNLDYSSGGSSGGAAAAVAARLVLAGHAGDGAGSIRVPAGFCGTFGMKPSRGLMPMGPDVLESPGGTTTSGFITLSVRDNAALLDAVSAPVTGALYPSFGQGDVLYNGLERSPDRLRIGLVRRPLADVPVLPELLSAIDDTARLCEELGHEIVEIEFPFDHAQVLEAIWLHWAVSICSAVHRVDKRRGYPGAIRDASRFVQLLWEKGRVLSAPDYLANLNFLQGTGASTARWLEEKRIDVWLSPLATGFAPRIGWLDAEMTDPEEVFIRQRDFFSFTPFVNHMGTPGMSVPLQWSAGGLPIGSHFVGRAGDDKLLLRLARQLEIARPWIDRLPQPA